MPILQNSDGGPPPSRTHLEEVVRLKVELELANKLKPLNGEEIMNVCIPYLLTEIDGTVMNDDIVMVTYCPHYLGFP